jgi:serine/threonine protein phosphatase PrpC
MSHRYSGAPRQDSFCVGSDGQWVVFAIADGVSQGHYSQVAAETAARAACKLLLEAATSSADGCGLDELDWSLMCDRISRRILDEAKYRKLVQVPDEATPGEQVKIVRQAMSTTAVVGAVSRSVADQGGHTAWIAALAGDSGAYKLADGRISAVVGGKPEDESGISESAVRALPGASNPAVVKCHIAVGEAVLLTSDGLGDPIGSGDGEIGAALANRWAQPPTATQFFEETNFLRRTFDDDRTAVGVWVVDRPAVDGADGFGGSEPG